MFHYVGTFTQAQFRKLLLFALRSKLPLNRR